jgi:hypothetical protein
MFTTSIALITSDIASKTIGVTINSLSSVLVYMSVRSEDVAIQKYHDQMQTLDIEFKLNLLKNWIDSIKIENIENNPNLSIIYRGVSEICHSINVCLERIDIKIKEHHTKWFHTWRTLYLDEEMLNIKKNTKILNERLKLINLTL